ncbi:MAG: acetoacetate decarboxylase family protein [Polyangiales bacterium]
MNVDSAVQPSMQSLKTITSPTGVVYPEPPWFTEGYSFAASYRVPIESVALPDGLQAVGIGGWTFGMLMFVRYEPPSPLLYNELVWIPAKVRSTTNPKMGGYYVAHMSVDDRSSLAAGREIWGLGKTWGDFHVDGESIEASLEHGTKIRLRAKGYGPAFPAKARMSTLQVRGDEGICFTGEFTSKVSLAKLEVLELESTDPAWESFKVAKRMPAPAIAMPRFKATMTPPLVF